MIINHHHIYINLVSKIIYYLCFAHLDIEEKKTDIEIEARMEHVGDALIVSEEEMRSASNKKMDTRGEEKLPITDDAEIIVQLERDEDSKRKRAHEDVVRNNLSSNSHILTYEYLIYTVTDILILHMQISIMDEDKVQIKHNVVKKLM